MTMKKIGTVTITEDGVHVEGFHFGAEHPVGNNGVDPLSIAAMEALIWAQGKLAEAMFEQGRDSSRRQAATPK